MVLAIKIGNTNISFGFFSDCDEMNVLHRFEIASDVKKTVDEYSVLINGLMAYHGIDPKSVDGSIIASVVPQLTETIKITVKNLSSAEPIIIGAGVKTGFPIKTDNPSELGADLVANAAAVINMNGCTGDASIIIDLNTATTLFAIDKHGEYVGGCIIPGIRISLDSLYENAALLPNVIPTVPDKLIGKNTSDSIRAGVIIGNAVMIDGLIDRFERELGCREGTAKLYATGEFAPLIIGACKKKIIYDENLTLKGMICVYRKNKIK